MLIKQISKHFLFSSSDFPETGLFRKQNYSGNGLFRKRIIPETDYSGNRELFWKMELSRKQNYSDLLSYQKLDCLLNIRHPESKFRVLRSALEIGSSIEVLLKSFFILSMGHISFTGFFYVFPCISSIQNTYCFRTNSFTFQFKC